MAHRVVEVEVRDGVRYFWPKGDNNEESDGCWIAASQVGSFIVALHRNVYPENAVLRESVNRAVSELRRAKVVSDAASALQKAAFEVYDNLMNGFCGSKPRSNCYLADAQYNQATVVYEEYEEAFAVYRRVYALYIAAFDRYDCWQRNATESERPGHIPHEC